MPRKAAKAPVRPRVTGKVMKGRGGYGVSDVIKSVAASRKKSSSSKSSGHIYKTRPVEDLKNSEVLGEGFRRVGQYIGDFFGIGDYVMPQFKTSKNTIMDSLGNAGPPNLQSTVDRSHIIRHREYLGDVVTGSAGVFTSTTYPLNPGISKSFPWLSALAQNFEQYRLNGVVFEFKSTSADALNSTNTALGTVILATEYNAGNTAFANKQQMENHEFCSSAKQSCSVLHPIECKREQSTLSQLYVRTGAVPASQDIRMYDFGFFQISTTGQQGNNINIGELWVTYEIEFFKPQLESAVGASILMDKFQGATPSTSNYFGSVITTKAGSNLGCTLSSNTITFPTYVVEGNYLIVVTYLGSAASVVLPTIVGTNCSLITMWNNDNEGACYAPPNSTSTARTMHAYIISISADASGAAYITYSGGTMLVGTPNCDVVITQVNSNIIN